MLPLFVFITAVHCILVRVRRALCACLFRRRPAGVPQTEVAPRSTPAEPTSGAHACASSSRTCSAGSALAGFGHPPRALSYILPRARATHRPAVMETALLARPPNPPPSGGASVSSASCPIPDTAKSSPRSPLDSSPHHIREVPRASVAAPVARGGMQLQNNRHHRPEQAFDLRTSPGAGTSGPCLVHDRGDVWREVWWDAQVHSSLSRFASCPLLLRLSSCRSAPLPGAPDGPPP